MSAEIENTNYDDKVWKILEENRKNWNGFDEEDDTLWPCNRNEISATKKALKRIDEKKISSESVIYEYRFQKKLTKAVKKNLPNNRIKMIMPLIILLGAIFFYVWYAHRPKTSTFDSEDWVVTISSEFVTSSSRKPNMEIQRKTIAPGTKVKPLAMGQQYHAKVKLPSGEIGYMHAATFSGVARNSEIVHGTTIFSLGDTRKEIGAIENEMPKILSAPKIDEEDKYLKVRTKSGRIGYIYNNHIKYHFCDSLIDISSTNLLPVATTRTKKWVGQTITEIEDQYSPVSAYFGNKGYWDYVRVIGDTLAYKGVMADVNEDGVIESIQFGEKEKLFASVNFFPIWRMIASWEPLYDQINVHYEQTDRALNIGWWQKLRSSHWTVKFITWIIMVILNVAWFLLKVSVLFLPVMVMGVIVSHLERPSYIASMNMVIWMLVFVLVYITALMILMDSFSFIILIILFIASIVNFFGFLSHLGRKCVICGNWDGEITEKTDFLGQSVSVQYGSRDKYTGSNTKLTGTRDSINSNTKTYTYTTTDHYKRVKTKDTYQYDNYVAHEMCKYCGIRWKSKYKILRGEKHQEY